MPDQVEVPQRFNPEKADDDDRTNGERAEQAFQALRTYDPELTWGLSEEVVGDLLADLLHLCDREDWDFDQAMARARKYHAEER